MANFITVTIIILIIAAAITYIVKEKKKGTKCIGCPSAGACAKKAGGGCTCSSGNRSEME